MAGNTSISTVNGEKYHASETPFKGVDSSEGSTASAQLAETKDGSFGVKVLAAGVEPSVDIVAVHGLNGHREKTWTADNGVLGFVICYHHVCLARILTYGYDSRIKSSEQLTHQTRRNTSTAFRRDSGLSWLIWSKRTTHQGRRGMTVVLEPFGDNSKSMPME